MNVVYPYQPQETSSPCARMAIETILANARSLSPVLPVDLGKEAYKIPYDMLLNAVVMQAERICAFEAHLDHIATLATHWCESHGIDSESSMVEDLVSAILDEDA